jgi:hypothetical protein
LCDADLGLTEGSSSSCSLMTAPRLNSWSKHSSAAAPSVGPTVPTHTFVKRGHDTCSAHDSATDPD